MMKTRNSKSLIFTTKIFPVPSNFHGEVIAVRKEVCKVRVLITSV